MSLNFETAPASQAGMPYDSYVSLGLAKGVQPRRVYGRSVDIDNIGFKVLSDDNLLWLPDDSELVYAKSDNVEDNPSGAGCRVLGLDGLGDDGKRKIQTVVMNGTGDTDPFPLPMLRTRRIFPIPGQVGQAEWNVGKITLHRVSDDAPVLAMTPEWGTSTSAHVICPSDQVLLFKSFYGFQAASANVSFRILHRTQKTRQIILSMSKTEPPASIPRFNTQGPFNHAIHDFWVECLAGTGMPNEISIQVSYYLYQTDNV